VPGSFEELDEQDEGKKRRDMRSRLSLQVDVTVDSGGGRGKNIDGLCRSLSCSRRVLGQRLRFHWPV